MIGQILAVDMHPVCTAEKERLTEECLELLAEVHALEGVLADLVELNKALVVTQVELYGEAEELREQLATEISLRTMGGTPAPSTPLWSNTNIKFSGETPPPYSKDKSC